MTGIAKLRQLETKALANDGKLDFKEAKQLAKAARSPDEKAAVRDMFAHDAFDLSAKERKQLKGIFKLPEASAVAGMKVGSNDGKPLFVARSLGPVEGYTTRFEATSAARMSGNENAAVLENPKGRFHAVELNADPRNRGGKSQIVDRPFESPRLQPLSDELYKGLKGKAETALAAYRKSPSEATVKAAKEAYGDLASVTLGVELSDLNFVFDQSDRVAGKININLSKDYNPVGSVGTEHSDENWNPKEKPAIEIGPKAFEHGQLDANAVVFHEAVHVRQSETAQKLYGEYEKYKTDYEAKNPKKPAMDVRPWITNQVANKRMSPHEAEVALEHIEHLNKGNSEAEAYVEAFMAAVRSGGNGDDAVRMLERVAKGTGEGYVPNATRQAEIDLSKKLEALYTTLPDDQRAVFDRGIEALGKSMPYIAEQHAKRK